MKRKSTKCIPDPFVAEIQAQHMHGQGIAGVDEVGRGCLAGPVVAACVVLDPTITTNQDRMYDSKALTPLVREELCTWIMANALGVGVGWVSNETIDEINILQASLLAMKMAIEDCSSPVSFCFIDGKDKVPIQLPQASVPKGDQNIISIAAASIVAKHMRDTYMIEHSQTFAPYGFEQNKGYGTKAHKQALQSHGPCKLHRKSFRWS